MFEVELSQKNVYTQRDLAENMSEEIIRKKVALRFELRMGALQAPALPLGHATKMGFIMPDRPLTGQPVPLFG